MEALIERISQLDSFYSVVSSLRLKAQILSQMIALTEKIDSEIITNKIRNMLKSILELSYTHERYNLRNVENMFPPYAKKTFKEISSLITQMDNLRAYLISKLIEKGYLKRLKEISIGVISEGDEYVSSEFSDQESL